MDVLSSTIRLNRQKAAILLVLGGCMWSLGGLFMKFIDWHPLAVAGGRSLIAAGITIIFLRRPRFRWSYTMIGGACAYASCVVLFVLALLPISELGIVAIIYLLIYRTKKPRKKK